MYFFIILSLILSIGSVGIAYFLYKYFGRRLKALEKKIKCNNKSNNAFENNRIDEEISRIKNLMEDRLKNEEIARANNDQKIVDYFNEKIKKISKESYLPTNNANTSGFFSKSIQKERERNYKAPQQNDVNTVNASYKDRDARDVYNRYINTGKLPSEFVVLNYIANKDKLIERKDLVTPVLYIVEDYVFPAKGSIDGMMRMYVTDAFDIIGSGTNIWMERPCNVRKMNSDYEIVEKGEIRLS